MIHVIKAIPFFLVGLFAQLLLIVTGLFICLLPKTKQTSELKPFTEYSGGWFPVHLPKLFWYWDNEEDGARGDHRGWYWTQYNPKFWCGLGSNDSFRYWWWLAIRNPANNFKRYIIGCDVRNYSIKTIYGQKYVRDDFKSTGWQLVQAGHRYHFYLVYRYGKSNRGLVIELGNKVQERHNGVVYDDELDYFKGFTFEVNPFKDIS